MFCASELAYACRFSRHSYSAACFRLVSVVQSGRRTDDCDAVVFGCLTQDVK